MDWFRRNVLDPFAIIAVAVLFATLAQCANDVATKPVEHIAPEPKKHRKHCDCLCGE